VSYLKEANALADAARNPLHVVCANGRLYIEKPEDRDDDLEEIVVRVFTNLFDANRYREAVIEYQMVGESVVRISTYGNLTDLFESLAVFDDASRKAFGYPLRIELCEMPERSHPITLSVLFAPYETRH
jgi:hypothetical protein